MAQKMIDDTPGLDPAEAMDACVAAKNCTVNVYGYSPIQLAFGYAPTIPYFPVKGDKPTHEEMSLVYKGYLKGPFTMNARCEVTGHWCDGKAAAQKGAATTSSSQP
jgi:hypothetical protein